MRQAGAEDRRRAQGHDGQDRAEQGGAYGDGSDPAPFLERVAYPDHRTGRGSGGGDAADDDRGMMDGAAAVLTELDPRGAYRRPHAQGQYHHHGHRRTAEEDERVEGEPGRGLGLSGFAYRGERRQGEGEHDGTERTGQRHHRVASGGEHHEMATLHLQGGEGGVLRGGGEGQSTHDRDEDDEDQPGAPATAKLRAKDQPDSAQRDLPAPVSPTETARPRGPAGLGGGW